MRIIISIFTVLVLLAAYQLPTVSQQTDPPKDAALFPPNAKPGECYAKVEVPAQYETFEEELVKRQASQEIEIIPPEFEWVEEEVLIKEASFELKVIPAEYEVAEERVLIEPAYEVLEEVDPVYDIVEEEVLVKPAQTVWKSGRGPIEKIDNSTGEILCLVEEPAEYKTVKKKVVKTAATVQKKEIPAEYVVVKKRVIKTAATTEKVEIPAKYKTVKVKKVVTPAQEKKIEIPQEVQTVTKTKKVADSRLEWRSILCETNLTTDVVKNLQASLKDAGYYSGPIDGIIGSGTVSSLKSYQNDKGLASGGITLETVRKLGVEL